MIPKKKDNVLMYAREAGEFLGSDHHLISRLVEKGQLVPCKQKPMMFWVDDVKKVKKALAEQKKTKKVKKVGVTRVYDTEDLGLDCDKCQALFERLERIEKRLSYLEARK